MALLPELDTRSVLHVVEENFKSIGQKTYAQRMIYIGEHKLSKEDLIEQFQKTIVDVNSGYCDVHVRGLLLVYDKYFVHIIEGSEDTIHRFLRFMFNRESNMDRTLIIDKDANEEQPQGNTEGNIFRRLKLLMVYHSIKTLLFKDWHAVTAIPPTLISTLDPHGPLAEHMEQLRICLDKISRLCLIAQQNEKITVAQLRAVDSKMETLPEFHLLDYLLQSEYILDLRHVAHLHRRVGDHSFYFESVWPLPTQFTPKLLYKLKIDDSFVEPLPVMPWEINKEAEEEEKEEDRSGSSSD